ncbi:hypothetical protein BPA30113_02298 [Burkholderia paludis]|uniref:Uncharacterized protein n=2 Tax=Burkholderiaceae TaxID=119060 RepID=A0A6P2K9I9_9BURK|nr:hypothetical protein BPA30113_02298 [Burkholderia paludis]
MLPVEDKIRVVPAMFDIMERAPDADLGSPGPLVHAIESLGIAAYEQRLIESVRNRPMYLNLWMVNRILNANTNTTERAPLLNLLRGVREHPLAANVIQEAERFLEHQEKCSEG